ncbi:hypothetical protein ACO0QE_004167 [Hanseniaspora vineae]
MSLTKRLEELNQFHMQSSIYPFDASTDIQENDDDNDDDDDDELDDDHALDEMDELDINECLHAYKYKKIKATEYDQQNFEMARARFIKSTVNNHESSSGNNSNNPNSFYCYVNEKSDDLGMQKEIINLKNQWKFLCDANETFQKNLNKENSATNESSYESGNLKYQGNPTLYYKASKEHKSQEVEEQKHKMNELRKWASVEHHKIIENLRIKEKIAMGREDEDDVSDDDSEESASDSESEGSGSDEMENEDSSEGLDSELFENESTTFSQQNEDDIFMDDDDSLDDDFLGFDDADADDDDDDEDYLVQSYTHTHPHEHLNLEQSLPKKGKKHSKNIFYRCNKCCTVLQYKQNLISKNYRGKTGAAMLVYDLNNVKYGECVTVKMMTGEYDCCNIYCLCCSHYLGWKYLKASCFDMKYKEGLYIIENNQIM